VIAGARFRHDGRDQGIEILVNGGLRAQRRERRRRIGQLRLSGAPLAGKQLHWWADGFYQQTNDRFTDRDSDLSLIATDTDNTIAMYGGSARAVTVVDRALKEIEPGVYAGKVKVPAAGRYDVAFSLDSPKLLHCFSTQVVEDPEIAKGRQGVEVEYLFGQREVASGSTAAFRFRLVDKASRRPVAGLKDVRVMSYRAPGQDRAEVATAEVEPGVYEAPLRFGDSGAYYVGSRLGRHKMSPRISPNKTWEGLAGGTAATFVAAATLRVVLAVPVPWIHVLAVAAILAVAAPVGDLVESLFKRDAGVKDSSRLFPGHGGALDRTDSLIYPAPAVLGYLMLAGLVP